MKATDYHKKILKRLKATNLLSRRKLAHLVHPDATEAIEPSAVARISRAIGEMEHAGWVECKNPEFDSWKITHKGRRIIAPLPLDEDGEPIAPEVEPETETPTEIETLTNEDESNNNEQPAPGELSGEAPTE